MANRIDIQVQGLNALRDAGRLLQELNRNVQAQTAANTQMGNSHLEATKTLSRQVNATKVLADAQANMISMAERLTRDTDRAAESVNRLGSSAWTTVVAINQGAQAGIGFVKSVYGIAESAVKADLELERLVRSMSNLAGSNAEGALASLRTEANRMGINFADSSTSLIAFMNAVQSSGAKGIDAVNVFKNVSGAVMLMGGSSEQVKGALTALQQMLSKGTVQAEELKGQLAEHLPGAMAIAAKAMNLTVAELSAAMKDGQVNAQIFVDAFNNQLAKDFGGAMSKFADSNQASLNRMSNAWSEFYQNVSDWTAGVAAGISKFVTPMLEGVNRATAIQNAITQRAGPNASVRDVAKVQQEFAADFGVRPTVSTSEPLDRYADLQDKLQKAKNAGDQSLVTDLNTRIQALETLLVKWNLIKKPDQSGLDTTEFKKKAQEELDFKLQQLKILQMADEQRIERTHQFNLSKIDKEFKEKLNAAGKMGDKAPGMLDSLNVDKAIKVQEEVNRYNKELEAQRKKASQDQLTLEKAALSPMIQMLQMKQQLLDTQQKITKEGSTEDDVRRRAALIVDEVNGAIQRSGKSQKQIIDDLQKANFLTKDQADALLAIDFKRKDEAVKMLSDIEKQNVLLKEQITINKEMAKIRGEYANQSSDLSRKTQGELVGVANKAQLSLVNGKLQPMKAGDDAEVGRSKILEPYNKLDEQLRLKKEKAIADRQDQTIIDELTLQIYQNADAAARAAAEYDTLGLKIKSTQDSYSLGIWQGAQKSLDDLATGSQMASKMVITLGQSFQGNLLNYFDDKKTHGQGWTAIKSWLKVLAIHLMEFVVQLTLIRPLMMSVTSFFGGGLGYGNAGFGDYSAANMAKVFSKSANGNAFQSGHVTAFASGGIINSPLLTPVGMNLTGEAGPEGVLPLKRNAQGKLGVIASGSSSTPISISFGNINVTGGQTNDETARAIMIELQKSMPIVAAEVIRKQQQRGGSLSR